MSTPGYDSPLRTYGKRARQISNSVQPSPKVPRLQSSHTNESLFELALEEERSLRNIDFTPTLSPLTRPPKHRCRPTKKGSELENAFAFSETPASPPKEKLKKSQLKSLRTKPTATCLEQCSPDRASPRDGKRTCSSPTPIVSHILSPPFRSPPRIHASPQGKSPKQSNVKFSLASMFGSKASGECKPQPPLRLEQSEGAEPVPIMSQSPHVRGPSSPLGCRSVGMCAVDTMVQPPPNDNQSPSMQYTNPTGSVSSGAQPQGTLSVLTQLRTVHPDICSADAEETKNKNTLLEDSPMSSQSQEMISLSQESMRTHVHDVSEAAVIKTPNTCKNTLNNNEKRPVVRKQNPWPRLKILNTPKGGTGKTKSVGKEADNTPEVSNENERGGGREWRWIKHLSSGLSSQHSSQEYFDDVMFLLDGLQPHKTMSIRCNSAISLALSATCQEFRMHLRAHEIIPKIIEAFGDVAESNVFLLCAANVLRVLANDRLTAELGTTSLGVLITCLMSSDVSQWSTNANNLSLSFSGAMLLGSKPSVKDVDKVVRKIQDQLMDQNSNCIDANGQPSIHLMALTCLADLTAQDNDSRDRLCQSHGLDALGQHLMDTLAYLTTSDALHPSPKKEMEYQRLGHLLTILEHVTFASSQNQSLLCSWQEGQLLKALLDWMRVTSKYLDHSMEPTSTALCNITMIKSGLRVIVNLTNNEEVRLYLAMNDHLPFLGRLALCLPEAIAALLGVSTTMTQNGNTQPLEGEKGVDHSSSLTNRELVYNLRVLGLGLLTNLLERNPENRALVGVIDLPSEKGSDK
eukprot:Ihof_evm14s41 gene=Ihof_evmTU14s41